MRVASPNWAKLSSSRTSGGARISTKSAQASLAYDRCNLATAIVHLGVVSFYRSHQAWYVDGPLRRGKGMAGGSAALASRLATKPCAADGSEEVRRFASITGYLMTGYLRVPEDPQAVADKITGPNTKIVSLTITEGCPLCCLMLLLCVNR